MKYKKYIVLKWDQYYPIGGLGDISDSFDDLAEAEAHADGSDDSWKSDYSMIVDRDTWKEVRDFDRYG